jgi:hypothetical protein
MAVLKAPPKLIRNATIQVRVEEEIDIKLRKYAEFIDATPAFVVAESLKILFNKDSEFREWFALHGERPTVTQAEKPGSATRTMFDEVAQKAPTK